MEKEKGVGAPPFVCTLSLLSRSINGSFLVMRGRDDVGEGEGEEATEDRGADEEGAVAQRGSALATHQVRHRSLA
jgi:hypothetical protein